MDRWVKQIPKSRMVYPSSYGDQMKYWFWTFYTPFHPLVRGLSSRIGFSRVLTWAVIPEGKETGRQDYLLGTLAPERSARDFITFLINQGFANHFVAWKDADELVSLRRLVDFRQQYHIRIFKDGEVRGHFEYTPEYRPIGHLIRNGFEDRTPEFAALLKDWIVPAVR